MGVSQPAPAAVTTSIDMTDADSLRKKFKRKEEFTLPSHHRLLKQLPMQ
jgi:hypothetical protein